MLKLKIKTNFNLKKLRIEIKQKYLVVFKKFNFLE